MLLCSVMTAVFCPLHRNKNTTYCNISVETIVTNANERAVCEAPKIMFHTVHLTVDQFGPGVALSLLHI